MRSALPSRSRISQAFLFPAPGFECDVYQLLTTIARVTMRG
jgi:hypothetical protein